MSTFSTHQERMCAILEQYGDTLLYFALNNPEHLLSIAMTNGELPAHIARGREEALPFHITGVTKQWDAVVHAREMLHQLQSEGLELDDNHFHITHKGPTGFCQAHPRRYDMAYFVPKFSARGLDMACADELVPAKLLNATVSIICALQPHGRLVVVFCNPVEALTRRFREDALRAVHTAFEFKRVKIVYEETLTLSGLALPESARSEAREMFTTCHMVVVDKP